jgi:hypothetical protein
VRGEGLSESVVWGAGMSERGIQGGSGKSNERIGCEVL